MTTDDAVQRSLADKVATFLDALSPQEASLFAASIAGGLQAGEGVAGDTVEVQGYGTLTLAQSPIAPVVAPRLQAQCSWQVVGPNQLCYICGSVRVQCVFLG
jgi:hypothetical protein